MLVDLRVSNFAIIENLHITFKSGLNILSGETGSGKSVLLKSLALLMGGKASNDSIRTGHKMAVVEGSFDLTKRKDLLRRLDELGIEAEDDLLVVRRIISSEDKSRVYLNGQLSPLSDLRDLVAPLIEVTGPAAPLIEMTGQHENRNLLSKAYHLDMIDHYAGTWEKRLQFEEKYARKKEIENKIAELESNSPNKAQRLDFLIFQRDEISALDLAPGEEHELENEIRILKSASRLSSFVDMTENALCSDEDSATQRINAVLKKAHEISSLDPQIQEKLQNLEQAKSVLDDTVFELRSYVSKIDDDPSRLDELEGRLSQLRKLQKKYGAEVGDILKALVEIEGEIADLQNSEVRIESLKKEGEALMKELIKLGADLHKRRSEGAKLLANSVNAELKSLNMKGVIFHIRSDAATEMVSTGTSDIEFMTQTSPKDPPRPLAKFASGGELSRILLALKRVVGSSQQPRTYLFDEVDTGVSGETAERVGQKLRSIAKGQQVICVTHLPQVAAHGDVHFSIQKSPQKGSVNMEILELKDSERVREIARLISGEKISKTSLDHAKELLSQV